MRRPTVWLACARCAPSGRGDFDAAHGLSCSDDCIEPVGSDVLTAQTCEADVRSAVGNTSAKLRRHARPSAARADAGMRVAAALLLLAACRVDFDARVGGDGGGDGAVDSPAGAGSLEIKVLGEGVVTTSTGAMCTSDCTQIGPGTISLSAYPVGAHQLAAWQGASCGSAATCDVMVGDGTAVVVTADFASGPLLATVNLAFATNAVIDGDIRGINSESGATIADADCTVFANAAGLPGTFVAYLSDTTGRSANQQLGASRAWILTDGTPFDDQIADLAAFGQRATFDVDEHGARLPAGDPIWIGGSSNGSAMGAFDCQAFSSNSSSDNGYMWRTDELPQSGVTVQPSCNQQAHLPCMQIGIAGELPAQPPVGRYAFVSTAVWSVAGVASADAQCAADAASQGLAGTFVAALATTTQSIADRAGGLGGPWRLPSGAITTLGPLTDPLRAPFEMPSGIAVLQFWMGAATLTDVATGSNCSDWQSTSSTDAAAAGNPEYAGTQWATGSTFCDDTQIHLLCMQTP
jgi:hypothetical protein